MDNISKILEAIQEDGQAEADKISREGEKRAQAVRKLYGEEARSEGEAIIKKAKKEAEEIKQRGVSQAGIKSRSIKLAARRQALEKTFQMVGEKLQSLSTEKKLELYLKLLEKYAQKGRVVIELNEEDSNVLGSNLINKAGEMYGMEASLSDSPGEFMGGVIIKQGETEINCTFEVMVEDMKKESEADVAAMLFA